MCILCDYMICDVYIIYIGADSSSGRMGEIFWAVFCVDHANHEHMEVHLWLAGVLKHHPGGREGFPQQEEGLQTEQVTFMLEELWWDAWFLAEGPAFAHQYTVAAFSTLEGAHCAQGLLVGCDASSTNGSNSIFWTVLYGLFFVTDVHGIANAIRFVRQSLFYYVKTYFASNCKVYDFFVITKAVVYSLLIKRESIWRILIVRAMKHLLSYRRWVKIIPVVTFWEEKWACSNGLFSLWYYIVLLSQLAEDIKISQWQYLN